MHVHKSTAMAAMSTRGLRGTRKDPLQGVHSPALGVRYMAPVGWPKLLQSIKPGPGDGLAGALDSVTPRTSSRIVRPLHSPRNGERNDTHGSLWVTESLLQLSIRESWEPPLNCAFSEGGDLLCTKIWQTPEDIWEALVNGTGNRGHDSRRQCCMMLSKAWKRSVFISKVHFEDMIPKRCVLPQKQTAKSPQPKYPIIMGCFCKLHSIYFLEGYAAIENHNVRTIFGDLGNVWNILNANGIAK